MVLEVGAQISAMSCLKHASKPFGHAGVGICISKALSRDMLDVTFHAYSKRLCALHLSFGHRKFQIFACCFPTSWAPDADVEGVYELLNLLLTNCRQSGAIPIIGGDFNASIGEAQAGEDVNTFGGSGIGRRNARGQLLMQWVLENGFLVQNRLDHKLLGEDSWTCCRTFDSSLVQIDFIFTTPKLIIMDSWCDFSIPIGLDHRCVHCVFQLVSPSRKRKQQKWNFKFWQPTLNDNGLPAAFQKKHPFTDQIVKPINFSRIGGGVGPSWDSAWKNRTTRNAISTFYAFETVASSPENFKFPRGPEKFEFANQEGLLM